MATLKLKPRKPPLDSGGHSDDRKPAKPSRPPLRGSGSGVRKRPTLAQAQALREDDERQHQQRQRQRDEDRLAPAARRPRAEPRTAPATGPQPLRVQRDRTAAEPTRSPRRPQPTWNAAAPSTGDTPNRAFSPASQRRSEAPAPAVRSELARQQPSGNADVNISGSADGSLRLSKYMGELGIASRREADEWIAKGWVRVDGRVVSELGSRVLRGQQVTVDAKARFVQAQKVTVLINKPVGYVSGQAEDGYEPAYVLVKPANQWAEDHSGIRFLPQHLRSLVPAGRLDIDSVGLLVLTQDGRIAKQLIGENSSVDKEYLVRVAAGEGDRLSDAGLVLLRHGLELDGEPLREAIVEWVNDDQLRFVLREGKKRQIRRMCEAVGLQVLGLKRVRIGKVMLGDLPTGQWRYLRLDESFE